MPITAREYQRRHPKDIILRGPAVENTEMFLVKALRVASSQKHTGTQKNKNNRNLWKRVLFKMAALGTGDGSWKAGRNRAVSHPSLLSACSLATKQESFLGHCRRRVLALTLHHPLNCSGRRWWGQGLGEEEEVRRGQERWAGPVIKE